jgi:hypothetical protein
MPRRLRGRRGFLAITFSVVILTLVFGLISVSVLNLARGAAQLQRVEHETQALYAAEAGLDIALQSPAPSVRGSVGAARYLVQRRGDTLIALGSVTAANGVAVHAAVTVGITPEGSLRRGTWRQVPPGRYPDLLAASSGGAAL